jgi:hypothetical protein
MTTERALGAMARALEARGRPFALVGGLAVSVRGEVRFTRGVDLAIAIDDDTAVERLVRDLAADGFLPVAIVEHEKAGRISTVRLRGRDGVVVDLLCASTGIESEIVSAAERLAVFGGDSVPVALAEDLLAMRSRPRSEARRADALRRALATASASGAGGWGRARPDEIQIPRPAPTAHATARAGRAGRRVRGGALRRSPRAWRRL